MFCKRFYVSLFNTFSTKVGRRMIMFCEGLFSQINHAGGGTFTSVPNSFLSLVSQTNLYKHKGDLRFLDPLCLSSRWTFPSPAVNGRLHRTSLNQVLCVLHLAEIIQIFQPVGVPIAYFLCKYVFYLIYIRKKIVQHKHTHLWEVGI